MANCKAVKMLYTMALFHIVIAIFFCFSQSIWLDEAYTLRLIDTSYSNITNILALYDMHVPFYFYITKAVVDAVSGIVPWVPVVSIAKIVSVIPIVLLSVVGAVKVRNNWGDLCGALFAFCVTAMPQMLRYAVEIRMYSWLMLFVTLTFLFAYDCAVKPKFFSWILLMVFGVACCYTHYFGAVSAVLVYAVLAVWIFFHNRTDIKWWLITGIGISIMFVPWLRFALATFQSTVSGNFWLSSLGWRQLIEFIVFPLGVYDNDVDFIFAGIILTGIIFAGIYMIVCFLYVKRIKYGFDRERAFFAFSGLFVIIGTVAVGCIVSWITRPIFVSRYMVGALGLFWLCFCLLLTETGTVKNINGIIVSIVIFTTVYNLTVSMPAEYAINEQYERFRNEVIGQIEDDDIFVTDELQRAGVFDQITEKIDIYEVVNADVNIDNQSWTNTVFTDIKQVNYYSDIPFDKEGKIFVEVCGRGNNSISAFADFLQESSSSASLLGEYRLVDWDKPVYIYLIDINSR